MTSPAESLPTPDSLTLALADEAATAALARRLAQQARRGDLYALSGDLGAGKTSFARAFINTLPGAPEEVPSPTFTLVQSYHRGSLEVWHVDLYRLAGPEESFELGLEEGFAQAITLMEWPERLGTLLPETRLDLTFAYVPGDKEEARSVTLTPQGAWRREEPDWLMRLGQEETA